MNQTITLFSRLAAEKYEKCQSRLLSALQDGRFQRYSARRKHQLLERLARYEHRLRAGGIAVATGAALLLPAASLAQPFPAGGEFRVNTLTTSSQNSASVAMDSDGDFVVVWQSYNQDGSLFGVYAQRYNSNGTPQGSEFRVNTWTTGNQRNPSVAMDSDGDFVVAWQSDNQDGNVFGVYAQRYNSAGVPQGSEFRVNTWTTNNQAAPSVAMDSDGDFVIAWDSINQDGSTYGVYAQRYNSAGVPQGSEFRINTWTTSYQYYPSVAMDSDGDFVVTWLSFNQDGSNAGIYAQRYNNAGAPQGSEFRANTWTTDNQLFSSAAMDSDGDFVVAWQSISQDGSSYGIYAQQYNSAGAAQGSEFRVNTWTPNTQRFPSVAIDSDGNFVVTWQSIGQDGSFDSIHAQQYNSAGVAQGSEFQVNTWTTSYQFLPSVAMDTDGNFVVAWSDFGQDGSSYGIYAQRYQNQLFPVELTYFQGFATETGNVLTWHTASERNNEGFEVERSADGTDFESIGFVPGRSTVQTPQEYRFTDSSPLPGTGYYRLRQTDFGGAYTYSEVIAIQAAGHPDDVLVYPNPAGDILYIEHAKGFTNLYNSLGQPVRQVVAKGETIALDIQNLPAGVYRLESGGQQATVVKR
jgi:hypothetical protein